jgi:thioredoxin reductase (NADPH)
MGPREQVFDCIIVGGGAAGLTAAIYLARYRRRIKLIDAGASRMLSIPTSHNYPGFAAGIHGRELLQRLHAQAEHYGVAVTPGVVERLEQSDGLFVAALGKERWRARQLLLATGVVDVEPDFPEVKRAVAEGRVRYCPVCDGYEAIGKNVAVLGRGSGGAGEARFVRHFADTVSLFSVTDSPRVDAREQAEMEQAGVRVVRAPVERLAFDDDGAMRLWLRNGERKSFDVVVCRARHAGQHRPRTGAGRGLQRRRRTDRRHAPADLDRWPVCGGRHRHGTEPDHGGDGTRGDCRDRDP